MDSVVIPQEERASHLFIGQAVVSPETKHFQLMASPR